MKLHLFNSLENKITQLELNPKQTINIYLCGPTVYDHIHIGNLRSAIIFDILHRLLLYLEIKVNYIQNITDIDDKIIAKSHQEKKTEKEISNHYVKSYFNNLVRYNILSPAFFPRVTNYIPQIQNFIASLLKKNVAYHQEGEVFFRVSQNKEYGKLSGQNLKKLKPTHEINQLIKADNKDFVLWKRTNQGITWNSPWGLGRPGWHTECVVFIHEFFHGKTIDIHGGGNDLLFPHHENERIQYLAHNNKELSKIWFHVAHIYWQKEKMSKSLGNIIPAKHFYEKYGANVLRYLILNTHHNQVINLNEKLIQQGLNYIQKIKNILKKLYFCVYINKIKIDFKEEKNEIFKGVIQNLLNNLNTIKILFYLEKTIQHLNKAINKGQKDEEFLKIVNNFFWLLDFLGFKFDFPTYNFEVKLLIKKWQELREKSQFSQADQIRNKLQEKDIL